MPVCLAFKNRDQRAPWAPSLQKLIVSFVMWVLGLELSSSGQAPCTFNLLSHLTNLTIIILFLFHETSLTFQTDFVIDFVAEDDF